MQYFFKALLGAVLLILYSSSAVGSSELQNNLDVLEEELEFYKEVVNNKNLIMIPQEYFEIFGVKRVLHIRKLKEALRRLVMNSQNIANDSMMFTIELARILKFSKAVKQVMRSETIPKLESEIKKIKQEISRQNRSNNSYSTSPSPYGIFDQCFGSNSNRCIELRKD